MDHLASVGANIHGVAHFYTENARGSLAQIHKQFAKEAALLQADSKKDQLRFFKHITEARAAINSSQETRRDAMDGVEKVLARRRLGYENMMTSLRALDTEGVESRKSRYWADALVL